MAGIPSLIANLDKRQFFSAAHFGEDTGTHAYGMGLHGNAIARLVCGPDDSNTALPLLGSWYGDRVHMLSAASPPDTHGFRTTTEEDPERNLYHMAAEEFESIGPAAVALLSTCSDQTTETLVKRLGELGPYFERLLVGSFFFVSLCKAALMPDSRRLRSALTRHIGRDWEQMYERVVKLQEEWEREIDESPGPRLLPPEEGQSGPTYVV